MLLGVSTMGYRRFTKKAQVPSADNQSDSNTPWNQTAGFHAFKLSFSSVAALVFIVVGVNLILHTGSLISVLFIFIGILFLSYYFYLGMEPHIQAASIPATAVAVQIESRGSSQALLGSSESEQAQRLDPERADFTTPVPSVLLVPSEETVCEKPKASTQSTQVANSSQEKRAQAATELPKQDVSQPSITDDSSAKPKLSEAAVVLSQIVKEALEGKEDTPSSGETLPIEESSEKSSETESEGVRQRKITPMEPQEHISLPDDGKKD